MTEVANEGSSGNQASVATQLSMGCDSRNEARVAHDQSGPGRAERTSRNPSAPEAGAATGDGVCQEVRAVLDGYAALLADSVAWAMAVATPTPEATATPRPHDSGAAVQQGRADSGNGGDGNEASAGGGVAAFIAGYRDYGGNEAWLEHFIYDVMPCEGGEQWHQFGDYSSSGYISPAQFHPGSWASAAAATGHADSHSGYDVGANVAWWSNNVSDPWGSGGWPVCGHRGGW